MSSIFSRIHIIFFSRSIQGNLVKAYVNFDDERLVKVNADDFDRILESLYRIYGDFNQLFIDEIQNINEWYLFVNRLLKQGMHILITGSNSKLLSGELASHLTGRHNPIELYPFSFADFCRFKEIETNSLSTKAVAFKKNAFDEYLKIGGFPELLRGTENSFAYVGNLVDSILKRDIEKRFKIRYTTAFETCSHHVLNQVPCEINMSKLCERLGFRSPHTVENYLDHLKQAYLIIGLHKYSTKSRIRITGEKAYPVDSSVVHS